MISLKMENNKFINSLQILSLILILSPLNGHAQETVQPVSQIQDSVKQVKKVSPHSLYTSLGYGNKMVLASTISQAQPFYYGSLAYGYNNEFFVSACTFHLTEFEPFLAYNTFAVNYNHVFNSWFDISTGISRYQIAPELSDTLFNSFFYGDLTLGIDWKIIYSKLSVGGLFSESSGFYFQMRNSRYFQTPDLFNGKLCISFDPYLNLLFGSLTQTVTADGTTIGVSSPYKPSGSTTGSGSGSGSGGSTGSATSTTSTFFGLMEVDLGMPIGFNIGKFTVEAEPGYVLPMFTDPVAPSPKGFVFLLNCYIKIF